MLYALILATAIHGADYGSPGYKSGVALSTERLVGYTKEQCEVVADTWRSKGQPSGGVPFYSARCLPMSPLEEALLLRQLQQTIPSDKVK